MKNMLCLTLLSLIMPIVTMDLSKPVPTAADPQEQLEQLKKDIAENPNSTLAKQKAELIETCKKMQEESKKRGAPKV